MSELHTTMAYMRPYIRHAAETEITAGHWPLSDHIVIMAKQLDKNTRSEVGI